MLLIETKKRMRELERFQEQSETDKVHFSCSFELKNEPEKAKTQREISLWILARSSRLKNFQSILIFYASFFVK